MVGGDAKKEEFINPRDAFYGLSARYDGELVKRREVERVKNKSKKFWDDNPDLKVDLDNVERRRESRYDEVIEDSKIQSEEAYVGGKQITTEQERIIDEEIKERVRRANPSYQRARLHYLGHRFNLIHPDETGLLIAKDNDDFNAGKLRLVDDLLRATNNEGDLREVKDRLISVGVYVKDLENFTETIKPMFQKREELLQKFYDDGSRDNLESLEKAIGEVFGVDIMYEKIKNGERAQPKKEVKNELKNEAKEIVWEDDVWKDLKLAVGYSPERDVAQKRLKAKYDIVFDNAANERTEVQQRLLSAINVAVTGKANDLFVDVEMAKNELRKYFGGTEISINNPAEVKSGSVEVKIDREKDEEREKYLEYLGGEFLEDLEVVYPRKNVKISKERKDESNKRYFEIYKFKKVTRQLPPEHPHANKVDPKNPPRDYKVRDMLVDYFKLESGLPRSWDPELLKKMVGGDEKRLEEIKEDLEEARTRQQLRKLGGQEQGGSGGKVDKKGEEKPVRLEEEVLFERFRVLAEKYKTLEIWEGWVDKLVGMSGQERKNALDQLQATMYLLEHPLERIKHADYWRETGMGILRDLRAIAEV